MTTDQPGIEECKWRRGGSSGGDGYPTYLCIVRAKGIKVVLLLPVYLLPLHGRHLAVGIRRVVGHRNAHALDQGQKNSAHQGTAEHGSKSWGRDSKTPF